jgi:superfamily II DNA or RNA helicase
VHLRSYQLAAVQFLHTRKRAFVVSPAGSGKTVIAAEAASDVAQPFDRIGWLASTKEQCEQAREALGRCAWPDGVEFVVCCVAAQPDVSSFDILILDEAHHLPAASWYATAARAARVVWGFSATPWHKDKERNEVLLAFFGGPENFFTVQRDEVRAGGHIAEGRVIFHDVDLPGQFDAEINQQTVAETEIKARRFRNVSKEELTRRIKWQLTADAIRTNAARNETIVAAANYAILPGESVLILVSSIEHGEQLAQQIPGAVLVHAKVGAKARKATIAGVRDGTIRCMIATSLADEGLDVPRASVLILAAGGRSAGKLEQRAGRVLRPHAGKEFGLVHDFSDRGSVMGAAQARARQKTYLSLGYTVRTFSNPNEQAS